MNTQSQEPDHGRSIHFPTDDPVGWVDIRPALASESSGLSIHGPWESIVDQEGWQRLAAAQGGVRIPPNFEVRLRVHPSALSDPNAFSRIAPHDIQYLNAIDSPIKSARLLSLKHLSGLSDLILGGINTPQRELVHIRHLHSLRHLAVCLPIWETSDEDLSLLKELKSLERLHMMLPCSIDRGLNSLRDMPELISLGLEDVLSFTSIGWSQLCSMRGLHALSLAGANLSGLTIHDLGGLPGLVALDLSGVIHDGDVISEIPGLAQIRWLDLTNIHPPLYGEDLQSLNHLPELRVFKYAQNRLGSGGLAFLSGLPHLEELNLSNYYRMSFSDTINELRPLSQCLSLRRLYLGDRTIGNEEMRRLSGLHELEELDLFNTSIDDRGLAALRNLVNLRSLNLGATHVSDSGMRYLAGLTKMRDLDLTGTSITGAGLGQLGDLKNLRSLSMGGRIRISGEDLRELHDFLGLEELSLTGEGVDDTALRHIGECAGLRRLSIMFATEPSDGGISSLSSLRHLESLTLSNTQISDRSLGPLLELENLRKLSLDGTGVSDASIQSLSQLEGLEELALGGTLVSDEGISRLRKNIPNCVIQS